MIQILNLFQTLCLQRQSFALFLKKGAKLCLFLCFTKAKAEKKSSSPLRSTLCVCSSSSFSTVAPKTRCCLLFLFFEEAVCVLLWLLLSSAVFLHFLHFFSSMILLLFQTLFLQRQSFALFLKEGQSSAFFYFAEITWPLHVGFSKDNTTTTMSIAMPC